MVQVFCNNSARCIQYLLLCWWIRDEHSNNDTIQKSACDHEVHVFPDESVDHPEELSLFSAQNYSNALDNICSSAEGGGGGNGSASVFFQSSSTNFKMSFSSFSPLNTLWT